MESGSKAGIEKEKMGRRSGEKRGGKIVRWRDKKGGKTRRGRGRCRLVFMWVMGMWLVGKYEGGQEVGRRVEKRWNKIVGKRVGLAGLQFLSCSGVDRGLCVSSIG